MSRRALQPLLALALSGALLGTGCDVDPRTRLRSAEEENRRLTAALLAVEQSVQPVAAYSAELTAPQNARGSFSMYHSPASLEQMLTQALPYQMSGGDFYRGLTGTITVERVSNIRFLSRNRLTCQLHIKADNVRYTGKVDAAYQKEVRAMERAVASGGHVDMEVQLTLQGNTIHAKGTALDVKLRQPMNYKSYLLSAMNERAFNRPIIVNVSIPGGQPPRRLLVTGNHVVVTYQ